MLNMNDWLPYLLFLCFWFLNLSMYHAMASLFKAKQSLRFAILLFAGMAFLLTFIMYLTTNISMIYFSILVSSAIVYYLLFRISAIQTYLASCFLMFHMLIFKELISAALSAITIYHVVVSDSTILMVSFLLSFLLVIISLYVFQKQINARVIKSFLSDQRQLLSTLLCHLMMIFIIILQADELGYHRDAQWAKQLLVVGLLYFIYIIIMRYAIYTADVTQHQHRDKEQLETIQAQVRQQNSLMRATEILNDFKHSYRENMLMIENYIEIGCYQEAIALVKHDCLIHLNDLPQAKKYSNNIILNSLLIDKQAVCDEHQIKLDALLYYPLDLSITDKECHEMFRILIQNAVDANIRLPAEQRYILIKSNVENQWLNVLVENPYDEMITYENGIPKPSQRYDEHRGRGLSYVEELIDEHQGILRFEERKQNHVFRVAILIRIDDHA